MCPILLILRLSSYGFLFLYNSGRPEGQVVDACRQRQVLPGLICPADRRRHFFYYCSGSSRFQLSDLAGLGYGLGLKFCVVFTILVSLTTTLTLILP